MHTPPPDNPLIITAQTLRHLLTCERRVWLDQHGDLAQRDPTSPSTQRLYTLGIRHEERIHAATTHTIEPVDVESWEDAVVATHDLMQQGVPGIIGACLETIAPLDLTGRMFTIRGKIDQLLRQPGHDGYSYAPVEIKQRASAVEADHVQLDLYLWLLGFVQDSVPHGELWLGADAYGRPRRRVLHEYDDDRLMTALTRTAALLDASPEPPVKIEPHCAHCPWYGPCQHIAQREKRIDLLYRVSGKTRANMEQAGITTLAHVATLSPADLQQIKGIGPVTAPAIHANARAWLEERPIRHQPLAETCFRPGWMFDLETVEVRGQTVPWCMGWCDTEGQTQITLVGPVQVPEPLALPDGQTVTLVPDSDSAWEVLAEATASHSDDASPIYHWTGYDVGMLRTTAPPEIRQQLEPHFHDLHATITRAISFPLCSTSIKTISAYLGYPWPGYNNWFAAYLDYKYWLDGGDLDVLARACTYQRADVQSMAWVWRWLMASYPAEDTNT